MRSPALGETVKLGKHMTFLADELGIPVSKPIIIMTDSAGAIGFARNNGGAGKMKHIDIRGAWVQQLRDKGEIEIVHVPGTKNPADFFTKILPRPATIAAVDGMVSDLPLSIGSSAAVHGGVIDGGMANSRDPKSGKKQTGGAKGGKSKGTLIPKS